MKILTVHNFYQQPGGEDKVFAAENELLRANGHDVFELTAHNDQLKRMSKLEAAATTLWSSAFRRLMEAEIERVQPDIVHFHNTFMLISPSAYYAVKRKGIPVVQTLHNYRLLCSNAALYRDGHVCEDCLGKLYPFPAVVHGCYHGVSESAVVATYLAAHRVIGTWARKVDRYIALTQFARRKMVSVGIPAEKIVVKPNFLPSDPPLGDRQGNYMLFIGRLVPEKGVRTLLQAWSHLRDIPLKIVGDGPLMDEMRHHITEQGLQHVTLLGYRTSAETMELLRAAYCLVLPSEWYEGFPVTLVEAFASGVPVLASRLGALAEIVQENRSGLFFEPGNAGQIARVAQQAWQDQGAMQRIAQAARAEYIEKFSAQANYNALIRIYTDLLSPPTLDRMRSAVSI